MSQKMSAEKLATLNAHRDQQGRFGAQRRSDPPAARWDDEPDAAPGTAPAYWLALTDSDAWGSIHSRSVADPPSSLAPTQPTSARLAAT